MLPAGVIFNCVFVFARLENSDKVTAVEKSVEIGVADRNDLELEVGPEMSGIFASSRLTGKLKLRFA